jgi:hypothetical protein
MTRPDEKQARALFDAMNSDGSWNRRVADKKLPNNALPHDEAQYRRDIAASAKDSVDSFVEAAKIFTGTTT